MALIDTYRNLRQGFREAVPLSVRKVITNPFVNPTLAATLKAEKAIGQYIPDEQASYAPSSSQEETGGLSPWQLPSAPEDYSVASGGGGSSSGGGGGTAYAPQIQAFMGQSYDLSNPNDLARFIRDKDTYYNEAMAEFERNAGNMRDIDIAEALADEQRTQQQIQQALASLKEQVGQYDTEYTRSLEDLFEGFNQGTAKRQAYYAALAPRVYQSSQGTSQKYAEGKYDEGKKRYAEDRERAMNAFSRAETGYRQNSLDAKNSLEAYKIRRNAEMQDQIANKRREIQEAKDQLLGVSRQAGAGGSRWAGVGMYDPGKLDFSPGQVGLGDINPFIRFNPVGTSQNTITGGAPTARTAATIATPQAGGQSLSNYLGYQAPDEEEATINAYKKGYGTI